MPVGTPARSAPNLRTVAAETGMASDSPSAGRLQSHAVVAHCFAPARPTYKSHLRAQIRIGIPRVLNLYAYAPLFSAYFVNLGVPPEHFTTRIFRCGEISAGSRLLGHRSLLSVQGRCRPRLRTAPALRKGAARRDLLPDVRRAHVASRTLRGFECMPIRVGNTGSGKSRILPRQSIGSSSAKCST